MGFPLAKFSRGADYTKYLPQLAGIHLEHNMQTTVTPVPAPAEDFDVILRT